MLSLQKTVFSIPLARYIQCGSVKYDGHPTMSLKHALPVNYRNGPRPATTRQTVALNIHGGLAACLALDAESGIDYITAKTAWQWLHDLTMAHEAEKTLEAMGAAPRGEGEAEADGEGAHPPEAGA